MKRTPSFLIFICLLSTVGLTAQGIIIEQRPMIRSRDESWGSLLFFPDNSRLITYEATGNKIQIRNLGSWAKDSILLPFVGEKATIRTVVTTHRGSKIIVQVSNRYSPKKNNHFFMGGDDSIWKVETLLYCYSFPDKELLWKISTPGLTAYDNLLISPGDSLLYGIAHMGHNTVIELQTGKTMASRTPFPNADGKNIVQSPHGRLVLFWDRPGFKTINIRAGSGMRLWDIEKGKPVGARFVIGDGVWAAAFKSDEKSIFLGSYDGSIREWSLADDRLSLLRKNAEPVAWLSYPASAEQALAVNSFRTDSLSVYSYPAMKTLMAFILSGDNFNVGGGSTPRFAFSPNGAYFALYHRDGGISVYRTDRWQLMRSME